MGEPWKDSGPYFMVSVPGFIRFYASVSITFMFLRMYLASIYDTIEFKVAFFEEIME